MSQLLVNNYRVLGKIGSGAYGVVHLCEDIKSGKKYAMKIVDKNKLRKKRLGQTDAQLLREVTTCLERPVLEVDMLQVIRLSGRRGIWE